MLQKKKLQVIMYDFQEILCSIFFILQFGFVHNSKKYSFLRKVNIIRLEVARSSFELCTFHCICIISPQIFVYCFFCITCNITLGTNYSSNYVVLWKWFPRKGFVSADVNSKIKLTKCFSDANVAERAIRVCAMLCNII